MLYRVVMALGIGFATVVAVLAMLYQERLTGEHGFDPVEDGLHIGSAVNEPPRGTTAVVNVCDRQDPYTVEACLWKPIDGSVAPNLEWLREVVAFIDAHRKSGGRVYVHCLAGVNRSAMVVTAYLMHEHGWSRDQALAFLKEKRPQAQPNPTMLRVLEEWEKSLGKRDGKVVD